MNWDVEKGRWEQVKGEARKRWGKLTDDDWEVVAGDKDKFIGKLRNATGGAERRRSGARRSTSTTCRSGVGGGRRI